MRRLIIVALALVLGALIQSLLPPWAWLGGIKPPVLAAVVLYYALRCEKREMWRIVVVAALLHDGLDMGRTGFACLAFPAMAILAQKIRFEVFPDGIFTQLFVGGFSAVLVSLIAILVLTGTGERPNQTSLNLLRLFGSFWAGLVTLPIVSRLLRRAEAGLPQRREVRWK